MFGEFALKLPDDRQVKIRFVEGDRDPAEQFGNGGVKCEHDTPTVRSRIPIGDFSGQVHPHREALLVPLHHIRRQEDQNGARFQAGRAPSAAV